MPVVEMPLVRGHFVNAGSPVPMQRELGPPRPDGPWAAAIVDAARFFTLRPTSPLGFFNLATGAVVSYAPELVPELPHESPLIVYTLALDADDNKPIGRPVPEWTPGAEGAPLGPARFAMAGDVAVEEALSAFLPIVPGGEVPREWGVERPRLLYAGRYAPPAMAAALADGDALFARFDALVRTRPWLLFLEGCLDVQGLLLALDDFALTPLRRPPANPRAWWTALAGGYTTLFTAATTHGVPRFRETPTSRELLEHLALLGAVARAPDGDYVLSVVATAGATLASIGAFFATHGRRAAGTLAERLRDGDVAIEAPGRAAAEMVRRAAVALAPDTNLAQARARLLDPGERVRWPLVAVTPAEWTPHALAHALTVLLAAPHPRTAGGIFAATGANVPFKLLVVGAAAPAWLPLSS